MRTGSGRCVFLAAALLIAAALVPGCADLTVSRTVYPVHLDPANAGPLTITFIDVGQGDATLLRIGNRTVLVDAGPPESGPGLVRELSAAGVRNISLLVATHPHADHIGGMHDVLAHFRVERVLDGTSPHTSGLYTNFLSDIDRKGIPYTEAARGQVFDVGDGLSITVLGPPGRKVSDDYNENSIVLLARYGRIGILLTGDAGIAAENELLQSGMPLSAEVLKVGHHGSSDASGAAFLAAVAPEVAVIPVGEGNDYGHPHDETLDRLGRAVPLIYRTDRDGSVVVRTDGMNYSVTPGISRAAVSGTGNTPVTAGTGTWSTTAIAWSTTAIAAGTG
jgi:competence protein ComEC